MKRILFFSWNDQCTIDSEVDMLEAFREQGHSVVLEGYFVKGKNGYSNKKVIGECENYIVEHSPDFVFSFGFFPNIATACHNQGVIYVSWVYDNPSVLLYSYTLAYETNRVFVFDTDTYYKFHEEGFQNIFYLPMAVNVVRLKKMNNYDDFYQSKFCNQGEVAFVGSMYTERQNYYDNMTDLSEYAKGYLEGLIASQRNIYGYDIVESSLNEKVLLEMIDNLQLKPDSEGVETYRWLYTNFVIHRKITSLERREFLEEIGKKHTVDLYTKDAKMEFPGIINHGFVDYYNMAPYVYKQAKINLNISLRSITNGIPLRCFDIMGAGGFLLTNYQGDFLRYFVPDDDFVFFDSMESLVKKVDYYLLSSSENERKDIAKNGLKKIEENHTYNHRVQEILSYL